MPYAQVNGQSLHYTDTGGDKPALIFSHGLLMDGEMFTEQVAEFKHDYRCVTWDERGHGGTGDAHTPFSYYDSANDAVALLNSLNIKRAVFIGMSQGGFLSLRAALTHPETVRGVVLLGSQAGKETPETLPTNTALVEAWATQGLSDDMAAMIEHIIGGERFVGAPWRAKWAKVTPANLAQIFATLVSRDDLTNELHRITAPTLVIHGDADAAIPVERGEIVANGIANAKLVVIAGGGHAANMTHAPEVNQAIRTFLNTLA
jgi:pimeloyl-ACP methyl ester carboxylesterase